jgi:CRP-like cAMP-binding protein
MSGPLAVPSERQRHYERGATLFRAGEPGDHMVVVRTGSVRVNRDLGDRQLSLGVAGPGDMLGEDGIVGNVHTTTATALEPTDVLLVDGPSLEAMVTEDPVLAVRLVLALMAKLGAYQERLALLARPSAGRLALALARLAEQIGQKDEDGTLIPRKLRDLAGDVGLDEATLGTASTVLVRERLVRVKKHGIVVPNVARMYEFVKSSDAVEPSSKGAEPVRPHGA